MKNFSYIFKMSALILTIATICSISPVFGQQDGNNEVNLKSITDKMTRLRSDMEVATQNLHTDKLDKSVHLDPKVVEGSFQNALIDKLGSVRQTITDLMNAKADIEKDINLALNQITTEANGILSNVNYLNLETERLLAAKNELNDLYKEYRTILDADFASLMDKYKQLLNKDDQREVSPKYFDKDSILQKISELRNQLSVLRGETTKRITDLDRSKASATSHTQLNSIDVLMNQTYRHEDEKYSSIVQQINELRERYAMNID